MNSKLQEKYIDSQGLWKPKYIQVDEKVLKEHWNIIKQLVIEGSIKGYISEQDAKLMITEEPRCGRLYGLVKDHKPVDETGIPPLREVVSCSGSNSEFISAYVDHHLKPEVKKLKTFIEDTPDFLREIERHNTECRLPENAIPVSMDIVALYPNVPWEEGLEAMKNAANSRDNISVPTEYLIRLMLTVLATNIFEFDSKLYLQKYGTAIGTRAAPTFANLFMGWWEKNLESTWTGTPILMFKRFIDDLFFIWTGSEQELQDFIRHANSIFPSIKVTADYSYSSRSVSYLDMQVWIDEEGYLRTDLFQKANQKLTYLLPSSAHPKHICNNIPYSLAYRLLRICWSKELLEKRLDELLEALVSRGYRRRSVEAQFNRVQQLSRMDAIKKVWKEQE